MKCQQRIGWMHHYMKDPNTPDACGADAQYLATEENGFSVWLCLGHYELYVEYHDQFAKCEYALDSGECGEGANEERDGKWWCDEHYGKLYDEIDRQQKLKKEQLNG